MRSSTSRKPQPKKVVLNLDKLDYVSSAGLRVILTLAKLLQSSSGELKICHANASVNEVLQTSGFNSLIKIFDDESVGYRVLDLIGRPRTPMPVPWRRAVATASILFAILAFACYTPRLTRLERQFDGEEGESFATTVD